VPHPSQAIKESDCTHDNTAAIRKATLDYGKHISPNWAIDTNPRCGLSSTGKTVFLVDHGADGRVEQDGLTSDLHWHSQSSRSCHAIVCLENLDDLASTGNGHYTLIGKQAQVNMIGSTTQGRSIMSRS